MPPRLTQETLRKATVYVGETNYYERQQLRDLFIAQGLRQVVCHANLDSLRKLIAEMPPDLLVVADDFDEGVFAYIKEIRFQRAGDNPFILISMLVRPTNGGALDRAIEAGVDDIIIKPVVSEKSYSLTEAGKYTFEVHPDAHKTQVRQAVEEIFGVTGHIQRVADQYAAAGYRAIAPAMFDRIRRGITLDYKDVQQGIAYMLELKWPNTLADVGAAAKELRSAGRVAIVGYCWGGLLTWRSACLLSGLSAAVPYYGGGVTTEAEAQRKPLCPVLAHFGEKDHWIPLETVESFKKAQPGVEVHVYAADHGFNCDHRGSYDEASANLALERTLAFFLKHLG